MNNKCKIVLGVVPIVSKSKSKEIIQRKINGVKNTNLVINTYKWGKKKKKKKDENTPDGIRTRNPRLTPLQCRRPVPYPLGHGGSHDLIFKHTIYVFEIMSINLSDDKFVLNET